MRIVVNSGPLISLARIGQLHLLPQLFGEIVVPATVFQEVTQDESLPGALAVKEANWLRVEEVSDRAAVERCAAIQGPMPAAYEKLSDHCPILFEVIDQDLDGDS